LTTIQYPPKKKSLYLFKTTIMTKYHVFMKPLCLAPVLLLLFFSSCKKETKTKTNCANTISDISGSYSFVKYELSRESGPYGETPLSECMVDDKLILKPDGTTQYVDAGVSCGQNLITGSWSISPDGKISIDAGPPFGDADNADINSFDCYTLVITIRISGQFTARVTLKK
jgi:hypothetical protein